MRTLTARPRLISALLAVIASIAGLANDFVYDDHAMLVEVDRLQGLGHWREILSQPYWPPPFYDTLYRPATSLLLALQYAVGGGAPIVFRLVSIALYAAGAVLFYSLAERLVSRRAALAAAALWAVHPVHVEAVAQAVNQAELLVGVAALFMVIRYVDARRAGVVPLSTWLQLTAVYALATLVKESAFLLPALLLLAELVVAEGEPLGTRVTRTWRGYVMFTAVAVVVLLVRGEVLQGQALVGNPSAALGAAPLGERMFAMLQVVPMWLRLFVWPLKLQVDFSPTELGIPGRFGPPEALGVALLAATAATLAFTRRRNSVMCFGLAWCAVGLLPVSNIIPIYIMLAERTLFLPSMGFFIAVAALAQWVVASSAWPMRRVALGAACGALCALGLVRSVSRQLVWNSAHLHIKSRTSAGNAVSLNAPGRSAAPAPSRTLHAT